MKFEKIDYIFLTICIIFGVLAIIFLFFPEWGNFLNLTSWQISGINLGGQLLVVFIVCVIGNLLPFPTPYTFIIIPVAITFPSFFFLIGLVASLGALIGEIVGYLIGRGAREALKNKNIEKLKNWELLMNQRPFFVMFLIFLFGLTPLNDDNVMVPIGLTGFDIKKTVISCWLGKLGMMLIFAIGGAYFGLQELAGTGSWVEGWVVMLVTVIIIWIMLKLDVSRFLKEKYSVEKLDE
ncbi:MAG: VTT domain-containing protein [Candidatus Helarchaeota archaeon]